MTIAIAHLTGLTESVPTVYENTTLSFLELLNACINKCNEMADVVNGFTESDVLAGISSIMAGWLSDGTIAAMIPSELGDRVTDLETLASTLEDSLQTITDEGDYFTATTLIGQLQEIGAALGQVVEVGNELQAIQALADTAGFLKKTGDGAYTIDTASYKPIQTKTYSLGATAGWYRIAESVTGVNRCSGMLSLDWSESGNHGKIRMAAHSLFNNVSYNTVRLDLYGCSLYGPDNSGLGRARIVFKSNTYTGEKCYLEMYLESAVTIDPVTVKLEDNLGWVLLDSAIAGEIPSGYTEKVMDFRSDQGIGTTGELFSYSGASGEAYKVWHEGNLNKHRKNHSANATQINANIQSGWSYGSPATSDDTFEVSVTYPVEFDSLPLVMATGGGAKAKSNGAPTDPSDIGTTTEGWSMNVTAQTTAGFTVKFQRPTIDFLSTWNYIFMWQAIGPIA